MKCIYCMKRGKRNGKQQTMQDGLLQESGDNFLASYSAYRYEDLPSDKFSADFWANYLDHNSKKTLGEQLQDYMNNVLKATTPN